MEKVMNYEIPHILEQILDLLDVSALMHCTQVSKTWREPARARRDLLLVQKWKERPMSACMEGKTYIMKLLLTHPKANDMDFNAKYRMNKHGNYVVTKSSEMGKIFKVTGN